MADTKLSALATAVPVGADYIYGAQASGPTSKGFLFSATRDYTNMVYSAYSTDGDLTLAVNTFYGVTMAAWASDNTATLSATAAVGDRIGIYIIDGDDAFEFLITATAGDTLNGVAGGTEWSRLFILGEYIIMRCVVANTTWVVEHDGRIAANARIVLTTDADGETAATMALPTDFSGAWTQNTNVGITVDTATGKYTPRRAGNYSFFLSGRSKDAVADAKYWKIDCWKSATTSFGENKTTNPVSTAVNAIAMVPSLAVAVGDYFQFRYTSEAGSLGCRGTLSLTQFAVQEIL